MVRRRREYKIRRENTIFMGELILPSLVILLVFQIFPVINGIITSFYYEPMAQAQRSFVGWKNYHHLLFSSSHFFRVVIPNTFIYALSTVGTQLILGIAIAVLLNREWKCSGIIRTVLLFPFMISPVVSAFMFRWMFNDQFGIVNVVLSALGFSPPAWLASRWSAMSVLVLADVWAWTPWITLFLLAALQNEPPGAVEAARLDGANALQVFKNVTFPYLVPVISVLALIRSFDAFRQFDQVWVITKGGPGRDTELFSVFTYKVSFVYGRFGLGAAAGLLGAAITLVFGLVMYRAFTRGTQT